MSDAPASGDGRGWSLASAALLAAAFAERIHNAVAFPPLRDFDGPPHALSVFSLYQGSLPDPRSWAGFHPPLYYALGAAAWRLAPDAVPVHAMLRVLSALAGFAALAIVWRTLARFVPRADAAVVVALAACAPVFAIATSMLGNETLCAFFATAALAGLCAQPDEPRELRRQAVRVGLLAGLAALSKSTGLAALAAAVATLAWRARAIGRPALRAALLAGAIGVLVSAPFYLWLVAETGSPRAVIGGGKPSDAAGSEMSAQLPGERHLSDYFLLPPAMLTAPVKDAPGMLRSVPGLLYASTWADGHGQFLPPRARGVLRAASASALGGLLPTGVGAVGLLALARRRRDYAWAAGPLAFAALLLAAFLVQTWVVPVYSAVKASYLLPALLPFSICLALGLARFGGRARTALRAALLATAAFDAGLTWYGWWS